MRCDNSCLARVSRLFSLLLYGYLHCHSRFILNVALGLCSLSVYGYSHCYSRVILIDILGLFCFRVILIVILGLFSLLL